MSAQPSDQHVAQEWDTPSHEEIPVITKMHVQGMESTNDDAAWIVAGMHHVIIHTIGRKSGNEHKVALPVWKDSEGRRIVVASFAGHEQHPSWFLNLRDTTANPEVRVRSQHHDYWSKAEILDGGDEYEQTWSALTADRAWYNDYQARTERRIPLVRLPETRPAS